MAVKIRKAKKKDTSPLDIFELQYEKSKFKLSPFAGKDKPFLARAFNNIKTAIVYFVKETYNAIKIILRGIL